jgi:hypothetical protein
MIQARKIAFVLAAAAAVASCSRLPKWVPRPLPLETEAPGRREVVVAHPRQAAPASAKAVSVWGEGIEKSGTRVLISTETRSLWLMRDTMTIFRAPIAVGRSRRLIYQGKEYDFTTPVGKRKVLGKGTTPLWVPPDWHYFEIAVDRGLTAVHLKKNSRVSLLDSTRIEVRGDEVGRVNRFGNFWPFTPGIEIIFEGRIFIPPMNSKQRRIPEVLGTHKLEMGDGYLLHGTNEEGSIGEAVSHGCVRMYNEDVAQLYALVPIGTPVYIF